MVNMITSNDIKLKRIDSANPGFVIVHAHEKPQSVISRIRSGMDFDIYHSAYADLTQFNEYTGGNGMSYSLVPCESIVSALDMITMKLARILPKEEPADEDDDIPDENPLGICCGFDWNGQVVRTLKRKLYHMRDRVTPIDLYKTLKLPNRDWLKTFLQTNLSIRDIPLEDPVYLAYALTVVLNGEFR